MEAFIQISAVIAIAAGVAFGVYRLRLPLILGHIATGILVGPIFLDLLRTRETIEAFSKLGITALLFVIGLSLSPRIIREVGRVSFLAGVLQVVLTTLIGFIISLWLGYGVLAAFLIALALTFSSTIIVTKVLSDKKELGTLYGKLSIGILLVQDLLATIVLIFFSASSGSDGLGSVAGLFIAKLALAAGLVYGVSAFVLPPLSRTFARSQEFLMLFSIGWAMGMAALFQFSGLSIEIGALAAGIALASSPFRYEISAKMKLLRDFFLVPFFILLGSELSFGDTASLALPTSVLTAFVLIGNPLIVSIVLLLLRYHPKIVFQVGTALGQVSEFSLLIVLLAMGRGWLDREALTLVTLVAMATMAGSTIFMMQSDRLYRWLEPILRIFGASRPRQKERCERFDILLFGCHRLGTGFVEDFAREGKRYLVVDYDPATVQELERRGIRARYGDAEDDDLLEELAIGKARLVISTIPDAETNLFLLEKVRRVNKMSAFIIIAHTVDEALLFYEKGATYVVVPHFLGGNHAASLIEKYGLEDSRYAAERARHVRHLKKRQRPEHAGIGALARP